MPFFSFLSVGEFLALFAGISGVVTALYLLDRSRQKRRVATLRFWKHSEAPSEMQHRRRIRQPWSLLLQLVSLLCLLLALAQLRWGSPLSITRDHVLILDTSAVAGVQTGNQQAIDRARVLARQWLRAVPAGDRVMLVRADALPTAATAFESNHKIVEDAITQSRPTASALQLEDALRFASQAIRIQGKTAGEIVYAGTGRTADEDSGYAATLPNLRVLPVTDKFTNVGLRKIGLRRSPGGEELWQAYVTVRNDGDAPRVVPVTMLFGKAPVAQRRLTLAPRAEQSFAVDLRLSAAGLLETRLLVNDDFADDNRAVLELPSQVPLRVVVFSSQPRLLRPVFSSTKRLEAEYRAPDQYRPDIDAPIVVLDRMAVERPRTAAAIWIDPPKTGSPVSIASSKNSARLTRWHNDNPLGAGLRARDARLDRTSVFTAQAGDIPIADIQEGPVILARPSERAVVLGFHPMESPLRYELATPLLFGNILKWLAPDTFLRWEVNAGTTGAVAARLDFEPERSKLRASMDGGGAVPFTVDGQVLRFFAGEPGVVRIADGRNEMVYSLTLPDIASNVWKAPESAASGVPRSLGGVAGPRDLWQWLAVLGGLGLAVEWMWYGRARRLASANASPSVSATLRKAS